MECKGKNVLYVGGFGGIGEKCCEEFLRNGVQNLVICDLKENEEIFKYLQTTYSSSKVHYVPINLMRKDTIEAAFKEANHLMGHLDIVINGGGIMNEHLIDETISINLTGLIHSTFVALGYMSKSKGGRGGVILNISSSAGLQPMLSCSVYSASKFAVTGFTRAMSDPLYYEETGVQFITLCPAATLTPMLLDLDKKSTVPQFLMLPIDKCPKQTPEVLARIMIEILEMAINGSVWLVENGKFERKEFPIMWHAPQV